MSNVITHLTFHQIMHWLLIMLEGWYSLSHDFSFVKTYPCLETHQAITTTIIVAFKTSDICFISDKVHEKIPLESKCLWHCILLKTHYDSGHLKCEPFVLAMKIYQQSLQRLLIEHV